VGLSFGLGLLVSKVWSHLNVTGVIVVKIHRVLFAGAHSYDDVARAIFIDPQSRQRARKIHTRLIVLFRR